MELDPIVSQPTLLADDHGSRLKDAAHLSLQSLGRAIDATDSLVQTAIYQHAHSPNGGQEYGHLNEKALGTTHTAMKYVTMASSVGDMSLKSDGAMFHNLFHDPNALPDLLMPMLQNAMHH
mmetsp:Transcript_33194/g.82622  ORF Transcript_33194/g.82622 Transcript_33194/m.82622 type:complete len:121 (+) Transcript_33194:103-465(+)